jgi:hypothetical protein
VPPLADAIYHAFPNAGKLDELLRAGRLDKRFDDLTSRVVPLRDNCFDVASKAFDQGWALELLIAAREAQPDNPRLRQLWTILPDAASETAADARQRSDRPSLLCGRSSQWNEVCQCAPTPQHHLLIVAGELGQDPLHFRDRIHVWLTTDPRRSIVVVDWPTRPAGRLAFFEAIARALKTDPAQVASVVRDRLAVQNLVLLHDCLTVSFDDPNLIRYYCEWIPELLSGPPTRFNLKCVQPIEWPVESAAWGLLRRLGLDDDRRAANRDAALGFVQALREKAPAVFPVVDLDELSDLEADEIQKFLRNSGLTAEQQRRMMEYVRDGPQKPAGIFQTIDGFWNQVQTTP